MAAILELPKSDAKTGDKALIEALNVLLNPALRERNIAQIGWWITAAYLQGMRSFDIIDRNRGTVEVSWEEDDGQMHMRWDELLTAREKEIGLLSRIDTAPMASKREHSLESLRNSSTSQVLLDNMESLVPARTLSLQFISGVVDYGTYGLASWPDPTRDSPLSHIRELIPPWELLGIPGGFVNPTDLRCIGRTRLFPLIQLSKMKDVKMPDERELGKLEVINLPHGLSHGLSPVGPGLRSGSGSFDRLFDEDTSGRVVGSATEAAKKPTRDIERFVRLREFFILTPDQTRVARYIALAGRWIARDINYLDKSIEVPMPIGIARYHDVGSFYGRSFVGKSIPLFLEIENLLENLIQNMADFRRFGYMLVPMDKGIDFDKFKAQDEPAIIPFEQDLNSPESGVQHIAPGTASDVPGRTLQFVLGVADRTLSQGPLLGGNAPGRTDSGVGFEVLAEMGATHLIPVAERIETAHATVFRSMLYNIKQEFTESDQLEKGLPLTKIENSIAGVTIDASTGRMKLEPNKLPDPFEIALGIRSNSPVQKERRRQEALQLMQSIGQPIPLEFTIMNYKEGWDFPIGSRSVWENYVKAVLTNLILFGDGENPGELPGATPEAGILGVYYNTKVDKPEVHLLAIEDFVSGPEFSLASKAVQDAFHERIDFIKGESTGLLLPEQLPPAEDAALASAAQQQGELG